MSITHDVLLPLRIRRTAKLIGASVLSRRPEISEILQRTDGLLGRRTLAASVVATRADSGVATRDEDRLVDAGSLVFLLVLYNHMNREKLGVARGSREENLHIIKQNAVDMLVRVVDVRYVLHVSSQSVHPKGGFHSVVKSMM